MKSYRELVPVKSITPSFVRVEPRRFTVALFTRIVCVALTIVLGIRPDTL